MRIKLIFINELQKRLDSKSTKTVGEKREDKQNRQTVIDSVPPIARKFRVLPSPPFIKKTKLYIEKTTIKNFGTSGKVKSKGKMPG